MEQLYLYNGDRKCHIIRRSQKRVHELPFPVADLRGRPILPPCSLPEPHPTAGRWGGVSSGNRPAQNPCVPCLLQVQVSKRLIGSLPPRYPPATCKKKKNCLAKRPRAQLLELGTWVQIPAVLLPSSFLICKMGITIVQGWWSVMRLKWANIREGFQSVPGM